MRFQTILNYKISHSISDSNFSSTKPSHHFGVDTLSGIQNNKRIFAYRSYYQKKEIVPKGSEPKTQTPSEALFIMYGLKIIQKVIKNLIHQMFQYLSLILFLNLPTIV